jgi:hypothetical protein
MRKGLAATVLACCLAFPAQAQESWTLDALRQGSDPIGTLWTHPDGAVFGLGEMPPQAKVPLVYDGCLIAEDGLTPIICAGGDGVRPPPEGFIWKDDPDASLSEPQHCLWWEEGNTFVGIPGRWLCRDGAAPSGGRPPEALPLPGRGEGEDPLPLSAPSGESIF